VALLHRLQAPAAQLLVRARLLPWQTLLLEPVRPLPLQARKARRRRRAPAIQHRLQVLAALLLAQALLPRQLPLALAQMAPQQQRRR